MPSAPFATHPVTLDRSRPLAKGSNLSASPSRVETIPHSYRVEMAANYILPNMLVSVSPF